MHRSKNHLFRFSSEVTHALKSAKNDNNNNLLSSKLVLLESAIITHGMPYPQNYEMARKVQEIVRARGAVPATIGIISGRIHVGLTDEELAYFCRPPGTMPPSTNNMQAFKISRRDLSVAVAAGNVDLGGTTVSGTLAAATSAFDHPSVLPVFVTGGIGGVHRGAESSMDVSADLVEMGRCPGMVVSAGVKSILDIGKTLEFLETQGVCVATFGQEDFPSFFGRSSGHKSPYEIGSVGEAAELLIKHRDLGLRSGILLAVPIPLDASEDGEEVESSILASLKEAEDKGVSGRDVTPFVLKRVNELTKGKSLKANLRLIENNADIGAQIAVAAANQDGCGGNNTMHPGMRMPDPLNKSPVVIGGSIVDLVTSVTTSSDLLSSSSSSSSTRPGRITLGFGGVGRNVADALACFDVDPIFISAVGDDDLGKTVLAHNNKLNKSFVRILSDSPTATYSLLLNNSGEVQLGVGDMSIHSRIDPEVIKSNGEWIDGAPMVVMDGNLSQEAIDCVLEMCGESRVPVFFEPTDSSKAAKVAQSPHFSSVTYTSPNVNELHSMTGHQFSLDNNNNNNKALINSCLDCCQDLLKTLQVVIVTLGSQGVVLARRGRPADPLPTKNDPEILVDKVCLSAIHYPLETSPEKNVLCVSGAGDCFAAAFIAAVLRGKGQDEAVSAGLQAARISVGDYRAVPSGLCKGAIDWNRKAKGVVLL